MLHKGKGYVMKKHGILNSEISKVLSDMGHTDRICIGDCGLPIPEGPKKIDLALKMGQPSFMEVLREIAKDMKIEKIILAEEMKEKNPDQLKDVLYLFLNPETEPNPETDFVSHEELKRLSKECKAVIRTGEVTPYSNIILQSACLF